jgi:hypothetical protein
MDLYAVEREKGSESQVGQVGGDQMVCSSSAGESGARMLGNSLETERRS